MSRTKFFLVALAVLGLAISSLACGSSGTGDTAPAPASTPIVTTGDAAPAPTATPIVTTGVGAVDSAQSTLTEKVADGNICDLGHGALYCTTHPLGHRCSLDPDLKVAALEACTPAEGEEALYTMALNEARAEAAQ